MICSSENLLRFICPSPVEADSTSPWSPSRGARHELQHELEAAHRAAGNDRERIEVELVETRGRMAKLVRRIEDDEDAPRALVQRLKDFDAAEVRLIETLYVAPAETIVRLPANYEIVYQRTMTELEVQLSASGGAAAREAIGHRSRRWWCSRVMRAAASAGPPSSMATWSGC